MVDRPEVEAQWCAERTGTNRPRTWLKQRSSFEGAKATRKTDWIAYSERSRAWVAKVRYVMKEKFRVGKGISKQISGNNRNVKKYFLCSCQDTKSWKINNSVAMAAGIHLFPCRTQQLSLQTPKVLGGRPPGRIGSRWLIGKTHWIFPVRLFCAFVVREMWFKSYKIKSVEILNYM